MKIPATLVMLLSTASIAVGSADDELAFFESKIRPVLVDKCYSCHSVEAGKSKGGLLLDSKAGIDVGGDSGPALIVGKPEESEMILAIAYGGEIPEMPPKERLPDQVVEDFRKWITMGAPDPREAEMTQLAGARVVDDAEIERSKEEFWAYQPLPELQPEDSVDGFIDQALEKVEVEAAEQADLRDLVRRLYFDVIGLPPTREQIAAFLEAAENDRARAVETLVDELLASSQFGEKWGRHWLDLARYADSNGGDINFTYPHAWRYRDYVIDAFNADKPYDQFIREQLAGDLMKAEDHRQKAAQMIATGYLVVGPKMLSERDKDKMHLDIADEQLDSIGRTFMGLTVGCARCHDHKFDAIPTADYYAMAGILRSTRTAEGIRMNNINVTGWIEQDLPVDEAHAAQIASYREQEETLTGRITEVKSEIKAIQDRAADLSDLPGTLVDNDKAEFSGDWTLSNYSKNRFGADYQHDDDRGKGTKSVRWVAAIEEDGEYEIRISYAGQGGRASRVPITITDRHGEHKITLDQSKRAPIGGIWGVLGRYEFEAGEKAVVSMSNHETKGYVIADAVHFIPVDSLDAIETEQAKRDRELISAAESSLKTLENELKDLKTAAPEIPKAMAASDRPIDEIADLHIRVRGEPRNLGDRAERGFLRVAMAGNEASPTPETSGRLEMAQWIASRENPLTARVWVNRLWQHLFGEGIVRTADNFGELGDRPVLPELLGWLAADHVEAGWSTKHTLRRILLSRAYQREAKPDPENRWFAHQNRRRLPAESIRDSMVAFSGKLEGGSPGTPVAHLGEQAIANSANNGKATGVEGHFHRAAYLPMVRNDMPPFLQTFDMANPDMVTGKRPNTTVPSQALLMLNAPEVKDTANALLARFPENKLRWPAIFETVLGRLPTEYELDRSNQFIGELVRENKVTTEEASVLLAQSILASTEFRFLD